jgi:hypothetical protein
MWPKYLTLAEDTVEHLGLGVEIIPPSGQQRCRRRAGTIRLFFTAAASIADIGFKLDESWSPAQRRTFVALAEDACARVATRTSIPAGEIVAWPLLDDLRIYPRGATEVLAAPVIELGHGLICPFTAHRVHLSEWSFGLLLLRAGDSGAAESSARPALEIARSNAQVHLLLGLILAQRADTRDEGIEHLKSAARTLPRAQEALKRLQDN